jgi:hypothetical protein
MAIDEDGDRVERENNPVGPKRAYKFRILPLYSHQLATLEIEQEDRNKKPPMRWLFAFT